MKLEELSWPRERLAEALLHLARSAGLGSAVEINQQGSRSAELLPDPPPAGLQQDALNPWFESAGRRMGIEIEGVKAPYQELEEMLARSAPAVVRLPAGNAADRFLLVHKVARRQALLLTPDRLHARIPLARLVRELRAPLDSGLQREIEPLLDRAGVAPKRRERARARMIADRASQWEIGGVWQLGLATEGRFLGDLRQCGVLRATLALVVCQLMASLVFLASWALIGKGALSGQMAPGWMAAWCLALATWIPLRILLSALQNRLAVTLGARLKRRLFAGGLRLKPDEIRHMGFGQLLGRVLEAESVETQSLHAVFLTVAGCIDLVLAIGVLALGTGAGFSALSLVGWSLWTGVLGWRYYLRVRQWTASRLRVTDDLVERMVGHRTRLAQEEPERWHLGEDELLERYSTNTKELDRSRVLLHASIPGLWLLIGIGGLVPSFVGGVAAPAGIAIALGGILLAWGAFSRLSASFGQIAEFAVAWRQVSLLFHAASRPVPNGKVLPEEVLGSPAIAAPAFLRGRNLSLRHEGRPDPVFQDVDFDLHDGEHVLLEGPSGCGKSSLASLVYGLREPASGVLLMDGLDRRTWGAEAWRNAVTAAPQYHENHIFSGTLAFNLFFGSSAADALDEQLDAEALCRELGLGDLIDRMPASLLQGVGQTGWQLSHGERSRVYLARTLLQGARLCVLDESLAALDPENLERAVDCIRRRARSSIVISHP